MDRKIRKYVTTLTLILFLFTPVAASAQLMGLMTLERLSLLDTYGSGGRPFAMGGAYTAVSNDAFALLYNPAGLTLVDRKEVIFGIHHASLDIDNEYEGWKAMTSNSNTSFSHFAIISPTGSYATNIVAGLGVFRVGNSDLEYIKKGLRPDIDGTIENAFLQSGSIYQYRFGFGAEISPRVSVGATLVLWDESVKFTETLKFNHTGTDSSYLYVDDTTAELDGISIEFGLMMWLNEYLRAGLTFSSPVSISYNGEGSDLYEGTFPDSIIGWDTEPEYYYIEDDFTLPMRFRGGLSFQAGGILVAADLSYCDYSQTKYNGIKLINKDAPNSDILKTVISYNIGAEFIFPFAPVRIRAGYAFIPLKLKGMDEITYVIDTPEEWGLVTEYDFYDVKNERQFFTLGIGGIIDDVLSLDLGIVFGSFERKTPYLTEKRDMLEIVITGGYRF